MYCVIRMSLLRFLVLVPLIGLLCRRHVLLGATDMEDLLETEIVPLPPRSFPHRSTKFLAVRPEGFRTLTQSHPDGSRSVSQVANWEIWIRQYWYETRAVNTTCPQEPWGVATVADWALMIPCLFGDVHRPPRVIYVNTYMLPHFIESTLRFMNSSYRFVLVSSGSDLTVPRSLDLRFKPLRGFSRTDDGGRYYSELLNSPQLIHWFAENHDMTHPKLSTLPTGMSVPDPDATEDYPPESTLTSPKDRRPMRMLVSDRIRSGTGTWALRALVNNACKEDMNARGNASVCLVPQSKIENWIDVTHQEFVELLRTVPFIACVRGGGIDPSPKAWEAIRVGTIPIIQSSPLDDAYSRFPVVFIDDWKQLISSPHTPSLMQRWADQLAPFYESGSELRKKVLHRLSTAYWEEQFYRKVLEYDRNVSVSSNDSHRQLRRHPTSVENDALPHKLGIFYRNGDKSSRTTPSSKNAHTKTVFQKVFKVFS